MNNFFRIYILSLLFFTAAVFAFADQPSSSLDDKPSVDTAASSGVQVPAVPSDTTAGDTHPSYIYDLKKLIEKSRQNIKEVNEKIKEQAVLKRNQKREERAHEYYEKGVELTNEGKLDEAREYFEKAIRITEHPEMAGYIRESQRRLRRQESALQAQEREHYHQIKEDENTRKEDVETAYKEAVDLYKQKKYHPAKDAFEHVDEIAPDYRATNSYLKIIDQDIIMADALAVKQQAVEVEHQQKEAEAARAKEKAMWLAQIEEKEKERKDSINKQAAEVYDQAVELYKNKKFAEAKKKFEEVSWVIPDYKATMKYLARIDKDAQAEQARAAQEQQKALQEQRWEEEVERKKQEAARQHELEVKTLQQQKDNQEQAQFLYTASVTLYNQKNMDEALDKFKEIENLSPDFQSTRSYIARIEQWQSEHEAKPAAVPSPNMPNAPAAVVAASTPPPPVPSPAAQPNPIEPPMPAQVKEADSMEDQQKQAEEIASLADTSAQIYRQISDIADDRSTERMKRKMAQVDRILNNLKESKERLLGHMHEEQLRQQQEERKAEAEKMYQEGLEYLRSYAYTKAKIKFMELENIFPDYKSTRQYLADLKDAQNREEQQRIANLQAVAEKDQAQARHLNELQEREKVEAQRRSQEEQERQAEIKRQQQQASLEQLAQKASDINDDIIRLSKTQDYEGMKAEFTELENTVTAVMTLKDEMDKEKDLEERDKQLARESANQRANMLRVQRQEDRQIRAYGNQAPPMETRPELSNQPSEADLYKRREVMKEQDALFSEGVDRYEHKKYSQAKLLFGELADQHDRRAEPWLKKVDRAITRELLKSEEGEESERTAFIADQVKAQRELIVIQERERQRQKKLTEELERQKRLYEDDRLLQLRKEEILKAQEREREEQEEKRLKLEKENQKQQQIFRFHKIETAAKVPPPVTQPAVTIPPGMTAKQAQAQIDYSNERKTFLDNKYKKDQEEKSREEQIQARADARQKRIEERAQRAAEREARKKAEQEARAIEAKAKAERADQEEKHREEFLKEQAQAREERIKQEEIMREEASRRQEMERQEHERQAQLESQRQAVRKELEDGVEAMYQEALSLYKHGEYTAAADRFKDVQDILPGYKRSEQYMDEARQKSLDPQSSMTSDVSAVTSSSSESRDESVSKALDLFDPNAK